MTQNNKKLFQLAILVIKDIINLLYGRQPDLNEFTQKQYIQVLYGGNDHSCKSKD